MNKFLFYVAASKKIGLGHLFRSYNTYKILCSKGADCTFVLDSDCFDFGIINATDNINNSHIIK